MGDVRSSEIGLVGTLFLSSLDLFRSCYKIIGKSSWSTSHVEAFKNEFESFLLWGNHYDPETGQLDRAVVALSKELRDGLTSYIGSIGQILCTRLLALPEWPRDQWSAEDESKDRLGEVTKLIDGLRDMGIELDGSVLDDDSIDYVIQDLSSILELLHEFVPALRIPLELDSADAVLPDEDPKKQSNLGGPASHYCRKILDRFPLMDKRLVERLGVASWQRHNRVRETLGAATEVSSPGDHLFEEEGSTDQSEGDALERSTKFHDSGLGTTIRTASKYTASQDSYQSFMSSKADIDGGCAKLPTLPSEALSAKPFTCSVCGCLVRNVKNKLQWRQHVYSDLRAYDCIVADCQSKDTFTSRGGFAAHLAEEHRFTSVWSCRVCATFETDVATFQQHIELAHPSIPRAHVVDIVSSSEKRSPRDLEQQPCPFCLKIPSSSKFVGHVSHHLEELSLSAIPQDANSDPESDSIGSSIAATETKRNIESLKNSIPQFDFCVSLGDSSIKAEATTTPLKSTRRTTSWSNEDDAWLLRKRAQSLAWADIAKDHFPNKSPSACRKRHERLVWQSKRPPKSVTPSAEASSIVENNISSVRSKQTRGNPINSWNHRLILQAEANAQPQMHERLQPNQEQMTRQRHILPQRPPQSEQSSELPMDPGNPSSALAQDEAMSASLQDYSINYPQSSTLWPTTPEMLSSSNTNHVEVCLHCSKTFRYPGEMEQHKMIHNSEQQPELAPHHFQFQTSSPLATQGFEPFSLDPLPMPQASSSSYWSVPEQRAHKDAVRLYRYDWENDWEKTSEAYITKTPIMVKNHFYGEGEQGNNILEKEMHEADEPIKHYERLHATDRPLKPFAPSFTQYPHLPSLENAEPSSTSVPGKVPSFQSHHIEALEPPRSESRKQVKTTHASFSRNSKGEIICTHASCARDPPTITSKLIWMKHMNQHFRPYVCNEPGCEKTAAFTYREGLLHHQREVHERYGDSEAPSVADFFDRERSSEVLFPIEERPPPPIMQAFDPSSDLELFSAFLSPWDMSLPQPQVSSPKLEKQLIPTDKDVEAIYSGQKSRQYDSNVTNIFFPALGSGQPYDTDREYSSRDGPDPHWKPRFSTKRGQ